MTATETTVLATARSLIAAGISVIPIKRDGSKAPALAEWKPYQISRATDADLIRWFASGSGVALVNGAISGNLETFDADENYDAWAAAVEDVAPGLLDRLPLAATPSGGRQLYYHCPVTIPGNSKLAQRPATAAEQAMHPALRSVTIFETRGEGGYAIIPPTPAECHPDHRPYVLLRGSLSAIPTISADERDVLLNTARSFNTYVEPSRTVSGPRSTRGSSGERPGDAYSASGDWDTLLTRNGWRRMGSRGSTDLWQRPGKEGSGLSATTNHADTNLLYVFSSNASPFEPEQAYSLFAAYTLLEHNGDYRAAAQALYAQGFGGSSGVRQGTNSPTNWVRTDTELDSELPTNSAAQQETERHPLLIHADALDDLPPTSWLVDGVIPADDLVTLYGASGVGKSHLLLDISLTTAQHCTVIYVAAEALETYKNRAVAWCTHHKRGRGQLYMWTNAINLMLADAIDGFINAILGLDPKLIIVDTLAMCMVGGDENSSQDMGIVMHHADTIRRACHASVVLAHHTGKSGIAERGSSALRGACGTMIELTNDDGIICFKSDKARNAAPFTPRYFRLIESAESVIPIPTARIETRSLPVSERQLEVLRALELRIFQDGATFMQIAEHTEMKKSTLNNAISRLLEREYITRVEAKNSKYHYLTAAGKDILAQSENGNSRHNEFVGGYELDGLNWRISSQNQFVVTPLSNAEFVPSSEVVRTEFVPSSVSSFVGPPLYRGDYELRTELDNEQSPANTLTDFDRAEIARQHAIASRAAKIAAEHEAETNGWKSIEGYEE